MEHVLIIQIVKFDTDQLPPILNALQTENGGQKLVLEVAVRNKQHDITHDFSLIFASNTWAKMSSAQSLWMVGHFSA